MRPLTIEIKLNIAFRVAISRSAMLRLRRYMLILVRRTRFVRITLITARLPITAKKTMVEKSTVQIWEKRENHMCEWNLSGLHFMECSADFYKGLIIRLQKADSQSEPPN